LEVLVSRGLIYGILAAAIWGGMYVVSDIVLTIIPPFTLLSTRLVMGAAILALIAWFSPAPWPVAPRDWILLLGVGLVGFGVSVGAQFIGTDRSTAVNASLITSASPAFILIFASLLLHEALTLRRVVAVSMATVGVVVIVNPLQADFTSAVFSGNLALAVAAITWGLFSVLVRKVSQTQDTLRVTLIGFLGGLLLTVPASFVELAHRPVGHVTSGIVLGVLYLGIISTALAMWLWNRSFALVDTSLASLTFFAQPLVGVMLSNFVLHQPLTPRLLLGGLLIFSALLFALIPLTQPASPGVEIE
jgi:drug/metabolite transporter (DMT)-like permease